MDRSQPSGVGGEDSDLLTSAINRPCTEALDAVISLIEYEHRRSGRVPDEALDLLSESLKLGGRDGGEHRAILAPRIPFLRQVLPEWFEQNLGLFLGDGAPDDLAQESVNLWLRWNRADRWLLEQYQARVIETVRRNGKGALEGFLLGMFWKVPGYAISTIVRKLSDLGTQYVSDAGETTARMLSHDDTSSEIIELGASFWEEVIRIETEPEALFGFGWWTEVSKLANDQWEQLTLGTCEKSDGKIDWAPDVAQRAAAGTISAEAIRILIYLVPAQLEIWDGSRIADHALDALRESIALEHLKDAREDLRRALLERGYHTARDIE